ncbi:MAG: hypothetical protein IPM64_08895 [Phycisphaerales bacterium]|nr:hypothetical protein [Phycisphaerales bacterium]
MGDAGFEPARGASDVTPDGDNGLRQFERTGENPRAAECAALGDDPDLAAIMAAWPKLGPATRSCVLRIIDGATRE